jgi:hypothetical protein
MGTGGEVLFFVCDYKVTGLKVGFKDVEVIWR